MTANQNTSAPFVVCPECEGEGSFGPGIVSTQADFDEDYEGTVAMHRAIQDGWGHTPCQTCKGKRVVRAWRDFEGERITADQDWRARQEYLAEVAAEQRYFGNF